MTEKTLSNIYHKVTYKNKFTFELFLGWIRSLACLFYGLITWIIAIRIEDSYEFSYDFRQCIFYSCSGLAIFFLTMAALTYICGIILGFYYLYKSTLDMDEKKENIVVRILQKCMHWVSLAPWKFLIYLIKLIYKLAKKGILFIVKKIKNRK